MWMLFLWSIWYDMLMQIVYPKETVKLRKKSTLQVRQRETVGAGCSMQRAEFSCSWGQGASLRTAGACSVRAGSPLRISHQSVLSQIIWCAGVDHWPFTVQCFSLFSSFLSAHVSEKQPAVKPTCPVLLKSRSSVYSGYSWLHGAGFTSLSLMLLPWWVSKE